MFFFHALHPPPSQVCPEMLPRTLVRLVVDEGPHLLHSEFIGENWKLCKTSLFEELGLAKKRYQARGDQGVFWGAWAQGAALVSWSTVAD